MTDAELLTKIKAGLGIATAFQDETLKIYIDEVKAFMLDAGVPREIVDGEASVGCILQGVNDLWNYSSGSAKFSEYFKQRMTQLAAKAVQKDVQTD